MPYYQIKLKANEAYRAPVICKLILIDSLGDASGVDVTPIQGGRELRTMPDRQLAFKFTGDFEGVIFKTAVDTTLSVFLSNTDVSLGLSGADIKVSGAVSVNNDGGHPVPVSVVGGVVEVTADNVGINNNDAEAVPIRTQALATISDYAPLVVGTAAVSVSNDVTLRKLVWRNTSATQSIALGGAGVTMDSPIILAPGDLYFEDDAAGAHWYAIADAAGATLAKQGKKL